jgi:lysozyme
MALERTAIVSLYLSATALIGIAAHEGFRDTAYRPLPTDVPTIGFGTTTNVKMGDKITVERALIRLLDDANRMERAVKKCTPVPMYHYEYNAYVSLVYNIGEGAYCRSTLARKLNAYDYEGACKEILRWNKFQGSVNRGLDNRRKQEYQLCIGNTK